MNCKVCLFTCMVWMTFMTAQPLFAQYSAANGANSPELCQLDVDLACRYVELVVERADEWGRVAAADAAEIMAELGIDETYRDSVMARVWGIYESMISARHDEIERADFYMKIYKPTAAEYALVAENETEITRTLKLWPVGIFYIENKEQVLQ